MSIKTGIISPVVVSNSLVVVSLLLGYNRWSWGIYLEIFYGSVMSSKHLVHIWAIPVCVCLFRLTEWLTGWLFPLNTPWTTALIEPNNHHSVTTPPTFALCLLGLPACLSFLAACISKQASIWRSWVGLVLSSWRDDDVSCFDDHYDLFLGKRLTIESIFFSALIERKSISN